MEIPYSDITHLTIKENFDQILPLLSIISSSSLEEVTSDNYHLSIGGEEELVARFFKAYENRTIDRLSMLLKNGTDEEVTFDPINNPDECRTYINNCINKFASELPKNKIYQLSFTKFLYRRVRFFVGHYYRFNQTIKQLGSIAMRQMIDEAKALSQINFQDNLYPRVYLVYDPYFSLHLLHVDWNQVSDELKSLFGNHDPLKSTEYRNKDYFAECLAWLIDIRYETFKELIHETKFILTENFAYKIFHVHERKLTKLALIIEGDTGVGKTFLLKFYSLLLNSKYTKNSIENNFMPRLMENSSLFLYQIITDTVENQVNLLNTFLVQIKPKILGLENEDEDANSIHQNLPAALPAVQQEVVPTDTELLTEMKLSLVNYKYDKKILYQIWKTILTVSSEIAMNTTPILIQTLHDYITTEIANYPLIEASSRLKHLLQETLSPTADMSIEIFKEYLFRSQIKPLFYRLLIHPGITEEQLVEFMSPISQLARELPHIEIVIFFDEVNTSSCLGLFKEMFMDGTLHGKKLPKNIFFTAAINPLIKFEENKRVHRRDYLVHELPQSLKHLKVSYGSLESRTLADYIDRKIALFQVHSSNNGGKSMPLEGDFQDRLAASILKAQEFCEEHLGKVFLKFISFWKSI
jgi:Cdc6-like AAA superfamily ATPase